MLCVAHTEFGGRTYSVKGSEVPPHRMLVPGVSGRPSLVGKMKHKHKPNSLAFTLGNIQRFG